MYSTTYPMVLRDGNDTVCVSAQGGAVEQLHIITDEGFERVYGALMDSGFRAVRFEHKRPSQLGRGLSKRLDGPWEMHARLSGTRNGILIHAEVEVSRDYLQHLFSQRTPVLYEVAKVLEQNGIPYRIWHEGSCRRWEDASQNYRITLEDPVLPPLAWKPLVFSIGTVGVFYLAKYLLTV